MESMHSHIHVWLRLSELRISHTFKGLCDREGEFYFVELSGQGAGRNLEIKSRGTPRA